ncbi:MAG: hypothetical protein FWF67_05570 [Fibromonadales bacterium]|nr:hypothetical protein [Fibromonadales bacterium]
MIARYHKFALTASIALAMALIFSCSSDTNDDTKPSSNSGGGASSLGSGNSSGGGNSGGGSSSSVLVSGGEDIAKWMKYNLNYEAEGSTCYSGKAENCTKYGRLYNWAAAMALPPKCNSVLSTSDPECKINTPHHKGLCPAGQHIPTKEEWDALITAAGGASAATKTLKSSDWFNGTDANCKGTDDYGFAALAGGYGLSNGTFKEIADIYCNAGNSGARWWSASEGGDASYAFSRYMPNRNTESIRLNEDNKGDFSSIRCLQDYLSGGPSSPSTGGSSSSAVTGGSSSSGAAQGGVGSCTVSSSGLCAENISQAECNNGTFSAGGTCGAQYTTYCLLMESNPVDCNLIGSAAMPSKASCPADEDGVKAFANETICGGSKGSCKLQLTGLNEFCVDVNRGVCEKLYSEAYNVTFQAGECGTTAEQYPCCLSDDGVEYFIPGFSKSNCYSKGGTPANASVCVNFSN